MSGFFRRLVRTGQPAVSADGSSGGRAADTRSPAKVSLKDLGLGEDADALLLDALTVAQDYERVSPQLLQRRLNIGYARAARLLDQLEERGYLAPLDGTGGRRVVPIDLAQRARDADALLARRARLDADLEPIIEARDILGIDTPPADELAGNNEERALERLRSFECSSCGRLEAIDEAAAFLVDRTTDAFGHPAWWPLLQTLDRAGQLRPAVLQAEQNLTYERAIGLLDTARRLGLAIRSGSSYRLVAARCRACLRAVTAATEASPAPIRRDAVPAQLRFRVLQRDGFRCRYCGRTSTSGAELHVDHIVPLIAGGETTEDNLVSACEQCDLGKGTLSVL